MHSDSTTQTSPAEFFLARIRDGFIKIDHDGKVYRMIDGRGNIPCVPPPRIDGPRGDQYHHVSATIRGGPRGRRTITISAHRLVYLHFHGPIPEGMVINHKDGDKSNNHPDNLEAVTPSENITHAFANGLISRVAGERNGNSRISDADAAEIRRAYAAREATQDVLVDRYGVTRGAIGYLVRGQTRASQEGPVCANNVRRKLSQAQLDEINRLLVAGDLSKEEIAQRCGVTRQAIYYWNRRRRTAALTVR